MPIYEDGKLWGVVAGEPIYAEGNLENEMSTKETKDKLHLALYRLGLGLPEYATGAVELLEKLIAERNKAVILESTESSERSKAPTAKPPVKEGYVLVPREPTLEMLQAMTMVAPTWDDDISRRKWEAALRAIEPQDGNTLCPKIGAAQWTCSKEECSCHLKNDTQPNLPQLSDRDLLEAADRLIQAKSAELEIIARHDPDMIRDVARVIAAFNPHKSASSRARATAENIGQVQACGKTLYWRGGKPLMGCDVPPGALIEFDADTGEVHSVSSPAFCKMILPKED